MLARWRTNTPFTSCHAYYPRVPRTSQQAKNSWDLSRPPAAWSAHDGQQHLTMAGDNYPWSFKPRTAGRLATSSVFSPQGPTKTILAGQGLNVVEQIHDFTPLPLVVGHAHHSYLWLQG